MEDTPFDQAVDALWKSLDLGPRRRGSMPRAELDIDGHAIVLVPTADERNILISAAIGMIAEDRAVADDQIRRLLREGAALAVSRCGALRLDAVDTTTASGITVEALASCDRSDVYAIRQTIEDVLFLVEVHSPTLSDIASLGGLSARSPIPAEPDGSMIFRL